MLLSVNTSPKVQRSEPNTVLPIEKPAPLSLCVSWAAVTIYHKLGGLQTETYPLIVLDRRIPESASLAATVSTRATPKTRC